MANPYGAVGSVATVASSISGGAGGASGGPDAPGGRDDSLKSTLTTGQVLGRLVGCIRPHLGSFLLSFAASAISVVLQLYVPILVGRGIDCIIAAGRVDFSALTPLLLQLIVVIVGAAAFQWVQGYCVNRLAYETVRDLRTQANDKLSRMPISFIDGHAHGDLMSRVVNDADQVGDGLLQGLTQFFTGAVTIAGTLAFMLSISVPMAVVVAEHQLFGGADHGNGGHIHQRAQLGAVFQRDVASIAEWAM